MKNLELTAVHQKAFEDINKDMTKEIILNYPNFNEVFKIHTHDSDRQLGTVISQNGKPLVFYNRKLSNVQRNSTTTEEGLLNIVETLKAFRNILLVQRIKVFIDHNNLGHELELKTSQR